ncbi:unnamed protein product [Spirodela intermedia]|uniref:DnaJ homologue subfamily C member 28 conserved domain-containing protein n=1 Tax=Spirodela intermedia TaxID=51605 RepID=A0A7I8JT37_SPIIN|nr:unnamed protein product [Spirodela intermedia]CAA6673367.1 unnamed protein product [Spirodela intermedia]
MRRLQIFGLPDLLRGRGVARARFGSSWADPELAVAATVATCPSSPSKAQQKKLAYRLSSVVDAVNERKLPAELRGRENAIRSETDIANVVEQRIWRSMEEGQFENLPGKGKPLDLADNPHADPAEDTLYRILSRNGCAPEWIELNKEIRRSIGEWRILRYNLMVPFGRQMFGLKWEREIERLREERSCSDVGGEGSTD